MGTLFGLCLSEVGADGGSRGRELLSEASPHARPTPQRAEMAWKIEENCGIDQERGHGPFEW